MRWIPCFLVGVLLAACDPGPGAEEPLVGEKRAAAIERGDAIAQATFGALSDRLQKAMAEGGPAHAVDYCWVAAHPITDSLSALHGVRVKRTSNKLRSPRNAPDPHEQERLNEVLAQLDAGVSPSDLASQAFSFGDSIAFYKPILLVSPLCLNCHGRAGEGLDPGAMAVIRQRYPEDEAIGYQVGEFRGLWSIRWPRR